MIVKHCVDRYTSCMSLITQYLAQCQQGLILKDQHQLAVLEKLQIVHDKLIAHWKQQASLLGFVFKPRAVTGLYIWGSVGCGKTFMMDCFYNALPFDKKMRMHFHAFMHYVQQELTKLQGKKNPLEIIAKKIAKRTLVLCFDEFIVNDIADAIILTKLLEALFKQNLCLVTTSNTQPDQLYLKGLQRNNFLPAIKLLKNHTEVIPIETNTDYRLRYLKDAGVFYFPHDAQALQKLEKTFSVLTHEDHDVSYEPLAVNDRSIKVVKTVETVAWFDFNALCQPPRSQQDYLEIVKRFHTVFLSHIPQISSDAHNTILLLIRLIDVLYDARTKLIFSAAVPITEIYPSGRFHQEFTRTASRLLEMQSETYYQ